MQIMNKTNDNLKNLKELADLKVWDSMAELLGNKSIAEEFRSISPEAYEFAFDEENHEQLVESALTSLRQKDPKATLEQAEAVAGMLQIFAKIMVAELKAKQSEKQAN